LASIREVQSQIQGIDVTPIAFDFDLRWLEPIRSSNAWMTRSERLLLFSLVFCLRPERYLEIGTFEGGSARIVCQALDALNVPTAMFLVDPKPQLSPETWSILRHRAQVFPGTSPEILPHVAEAAAAPFDFVLIDGDHSYQGCLRDALGVFAHLKVGAYILFHDAFFPEVRRAVDDFLSRYPNGVMDLGYLTRECMTSVSPEGQVHRWGGFRLAMKTASW
jgi:predicted O-methyltransferase YrrM